MAKRQQHTLARFYLQAFVDPEAPIGHEPYLWVVDVEPRGIRKKSPRKVARARHFYSVPDGRGGYDTSLEDRLGKLESRAKPVIARLLHKDFKLTKEESVTLALFTAIQVARVPYFRRFLESSLSAIAEWSATLDATDPRSFTAFCNSARAEMFDLTPQDEQVIRRIIAKPGFRAVTDPSVILPHLMETGTWLARVLLSMNWTFLVPPKGLEFITGDNPALWIDPTLGPTFEGHGLGNPGTQLTFPLGPELCLLATWNEGGGVHWTTPEGVGEINRRILTFGSAFAYAASEMAAVGALELAACPREE